VVGQNGYWLVDCADSPIGRLQRAGIDPLAVQGVIITHMHPDHVYGLPAYLLGMFLLAWKNDAWQASPLTLYARSDVLPQVQALLEVFASQSWFELLPLTYQAITPEPAAFVADTADFTITASPTEHSVPSIALRFATHPDGRAFVYSSDTFPCAAVETLAQDAALLFHEATNSDRAHTRPAAAGVVAQHANVERLVLIHYRTDPQSMAYTLAEAQKTFPGPVELAQTFHPYSW
jgi:ribonuclease Z